MNKGKTGCSCRKIDAVDGTAAAFIAAAAVFVAVFSWQVAAGASGSAESYLAGLKAKSEKRMKKELAQIAYLLDREVAGEGAEVLKEGLSAANRFEGNSQYHLLLARNHRLLDKVPEAVSEYRKAVESNRDFTDRSSHYYLGKTLRPFVREARNLYLGKSGDAPALAAPSGLIDDIHYLERSLAGGCH